MCWPRGRKGDFRFFSKTSSNDRNVSKWFSPKPSPTLTATDLTDIHSYKSLHLQCQKGENQAFSYNMWQLPCIIHWRFAWRACDLGHSCCVTLSVCIPMSMPMAVVSAIKRWTTQSSCMPSGKLAHTHTYRNHPYSLASWQQSFRPVVSQRRTRLLQQARQKLCARRGAVFPISPCGSSDVVPL